MNEKKESDSSDQSSDGLQIDRKELKKAFFLATLIGVSILLALGAFVFLVEHVARNPEARAGKMVAEQVMMFRLIFYIGSGVQFFVIRLICHLMIQGKITFLLKYTRSIFSPLVKRFFVAGVLRYAASHFPVVGGMMLFLFTRSRLEFYPLLGVGILLWVISFQKFSLWETWAHDLEMSEIERGPTVGDP